MRDWRQYVRGHLSPAVGDDHRDLEEIIDELASQLEDGYREAMSRGSSEAAADGHAREHIANWSQLAADLQQADSVHARPKDEVRFEAYQRAATPKVDLVRGVGAVVRGLGRLVRVMTRRGERNDLVTSMARDFRFAMRTMRRAPGFAAMSVLVLGLGIGATVAMFTTMDAILIRALPFPDPDRLVMGRATFESNLNPWASAPDFLDYRRQSGAFDDLAAYLPFPSDYTVTGGEEAERVSGTAVSVNLFSTLGVNPAVGRPFSREDEMEGAADVVLLSDGYSARRFGSAADAVGRSLVVDGAPHTVVGVMPAGFRFKPDVGFWRPMRPDRDGASERRFHSWLLVGRVKADVALEQARNEVDLISARLETAYPETNQGWGLALTSLHEVLVEDYTTRLYVMLMAVGLAFLIACGNVTGVLLARAPARRLEMSVRSALGASRSCLVRQLVAESVVLATAGGLLGMTLAVFAYPLILEFLQVELPGIGNGVLSVPFLIFGVALSLAAALLAGVYPAISGTQVNVAHDLKAGARGVRGAGTRFRSGLVVAQVAVAVVLLIASTLLARSFASVRAVDPGFDATNVLTAEIELPSNVYAEPAERVRFYSDLLEDVRAIPGVVSAGMITHLPIREPLNRFRVHLPGYVDDAQSVFLRSVLPGYFGVMEMPLLAGRRIVDADDEDAVHVVVINQTAATTLFPDQEPLGQTVEIDGFGESRPVEVVGIIGDVRISGLDRDAGLAFYAPYRQQPRTAMRLAVRTEVEPMSIVTALRAVVRRLDRDVPLSGIATMQSTVANSLSERRVVALSLTLYAVLPLIMAAVGLYAVLSFYVTQRAEEIGVRMALGASARDVVAMVLGRGIRLVAIGVLIGVGLGLGLTRLIGHMLFGIEPTDVGTILVVSLFVSFVAVVSCLVPAWRAARVLPSVALRIG